MPSERTQDERPRRLVRRSAARAALTLGLLVGCAGEEREERYPYAERWERFRPPAVERGDEEGSGEGRPAWAIDLDEIDRPEELPPEVEAGEVDPERGDASAWWAALKDPSWPLLLALALFGLLLGAALALLVVGRRKRRRLTTVREAESYTRIPAAAARPGDRVHARLPTGSGRGELTFRIDEVHRRVEDGRERFEARGDSELGPATLSWLQDTAPVPKLTLPAHGAALRDLRAVARALVDMDPDEVARHVVVLDGRPHVFRGAHEVWKRSSRRTDRDEVERLHRVWEFEAEDGRDAVRLEAPPDDDQPEASVTHALAPADVEIFRA